MEKVDFDEWYDNGPLPYVLSQAKSLAKEEVRFASGYFASKKPSTMIELGVQYGCSARTWLELAKLHGLRFELLAYDIKDSIHDDCVDRNEITFSLENITGYEAVVLENFRPDLVFLDAHPLSLTRNMFRACKKRKIDMMLHDVSLKLMNTHWERKVLCQEISHLLKEGENLIYENDKVKVTIVVDKTGLAIVEWK